MPKYSVPDGHWDEDDETEQDPDPRPRAEINTHSTVIDRFVDERYIDRYRWRFAIEDRNIVGWTRSDIEHNGTEDYTSELTWEEVPEIVRQRLRDALGVDDLDGHLDLPEFLRGGETDE